MNAQMLVLLAGMVRTNPVTEAQNGWFQTVVPRL